MDLVPYDTVFCNSIHDGSRFLFATVFITVLITIMGVFKFLNCASGRSDSKKNKKTKDKPYEKGEDLIEDSDNEPYGPILTPILGKDTENEIKMDKLENIMDCTQDNEDKKDTLEDKKVTPKAKKVTLKNRKSALKDKKKDKKGTSNNKSGILKNKGGSLKNKKDISEDKTGPSEAKNDALGDKPDILEDKTGTPEDKTDSPEDKTNVPEEKQDPSESKRSTLEIRGNASEVKRDSLGDKKDEINEDRKFEDDIISPNSPPRLKRRLSERMKSFRKLFKKRKKKEHKGVSLTITESQGLTHDKISNEGIFVDGDNEPAEVDAIAEKDKQLDENFEFPPHLTEPGIKNRDKEQDCTEKAEGGVFEAEDAHGISISEVIEGIVNDKVAKDLGLDFPAHQPVFNEQILDDPWFSDIPTISVQPPEKESKESIFETDFGDSFIETRGFIAETETTYKVRERSQKLLFREHSDEDVEDFMNGVDSTSKHQDSNPAPEDSNPKDPLITGEKKPKPVGRRKERALRHTPAQTVSGEATDESQRVSKGAKGKVNIPKLIVEGCMNFSNDAVTHGIDEHSDEELMSVADRSPHFNRHQMMDDTDGKETVYEACQREVAHVAECMDTLVQDSDSSTPSTSDTWTHSPNHGYGYDTTTGLTFPLSSTSASLPGINVQKQLSPSVKSQSDSSILEKSSVHNLYKVDEKPHEGTTTSEDHGTQRTRPSSHNALVNGSPPPGGIDEKMTEIEAQNQYGAKEAIANKSFVWNGQRLRVCTVRECLSCSTGLLPPEDLPQELQYLQLSPDDSQSVCEDLKRCQKIRQYSLWYNRWLHSCMFTMIFLITWLTSFAVWTNQGLAARTGAGILFLLALAVTILSSCICGCIKRKFDIECRHVLSKVNELLSSKSHLIAGLVEEGALSCYRLSMHILYFDTDLCLERLTQDLTSLVERIPNKKDKYKEKVGYFASSSYEDTDIAILSGDITDKQRQEFARQLLYRYCDEFINSTVRGRIRRIQGGRHSKDGPCLCQFIGQRFFNLRDEELA